MTEIAFCKYHGTGNDFILIDGRTLKSFPSNNQIAQLCRRRFGIGADGFIILEESSKADFKMRYYNSDGNISTLCGNGSRCIVQFAKDIGVIQENKTVFESSAGIHYAYLSENKVEIQMPDTTLPLKRNNHYFIDTGSPHVIIFKKNVNEIDVYQEGKNIRYGNLYKTEGTNVNFVEILNEKTLYVRTYERGVEDETYSCGTGVTAAAITYHFLHKNNVPLNITIHTPGGKLEVKASRNEKKYSDIWLSGPAEFVFKGIIKI
jgi:diaminopimelate epimerase